MFTYLIQLFDLFADGTIGLFLVFFVLSWSIHTIKNIYATKYKEIEGVDFDKRLGVSVIIPVLDEYSVVWHNVLVHITHATQGLKSEVIVVANGKHSEDNARTAKEFGFKTLRINKASKRLAIDVGSKEAKYPITILLDSDTYTPKGTIEKLLVVFNDPTVGGVTPRHVINDRNKNIVRRVSDWLEDIRFEEVLKGQSVGGAVSCLPGRLYAIRTNLLKQAGPGLVSQTFLGSKCISGDDRYLTSWLLKNGYKSVYQSSATVYTAAPDTLKELTNQRLRWSRTSFRETLLSLPWIWRYKFTAFTVLSTTIMRWIFFVVLVNGALVWSNLRHQDHFIWDTYPWLNHTWIIILGVTIGFLIGGLLKNARHLVRYPRDIFYLPAFLFITTFILMPVEWRGNLTLRESGWLTRRT